MKFPTSLHFHVDDGGDTFENAPHESRKNSGSVFSVFLHNKEQRRVFKKILMCVDRAYVCLH